MTERELSDFIVAKSTTARANFDDTDTSLLLEPDFTPYHETLENMFLWSEQEDGFAELIIDYPTTGYETSVKLKLYDNKERPVTLRQYVTRGHGGDFADVPFQRRYRWLLEDCDIKLIEPERKKNNGEEKESTIQSN